MLGYGVGGGGHRRSHSILNEEIARFTGVSDEDIFTQIIDYGTISRGGGELVGEVS